MTLAGLPHSEISGSMRACRSPKHIVACHVLHRLSVPRHPPSTLSNLTIKCLDLMRSAVESSKSDSSCILFYNPYSIVKELRSRRPTLSSNPLSVRAHRSSRGARSFSRCGKPLQPGAVGGADRDRTDDPLLAKQVLSQLSYSPVRFGSQIED
jgi:hypothetical protein